MQKKRWFSLVIKCPRKVSNIASWLSVGILVFASTVMGKASPTKFKLSQLSNGSVRLGTQGELRFYEGLENDFLPLINSLDKKDKDRTSEEKALISSEVKRLHPSLASDNFAPWKLLPLPKHILNRGVNLGHQFHGGSFVLENDTDQAVSIFLRNETPYIQAISLFRLPELANAGPIEFLGRAGLGDLQGPAAVNANSALFRLELAPHTTQYFVFFFQSDLLQMDLRLLSRDAYVSSQLAEEICIAFAAGALLTVCFYNFFLWFTFRDRLYLIYTTFVFFNLCFLLCMHGYAIRMIRLGTSWDIDFNFLALYAAFAMLCVAMVFSDYFNETLIHSPRAKYFRRVLLWTMASFYVSYVFWPRHTAEIQGLVTNLIIIYIFYGAITAMRRGNRPSRIFFAAWSIYLVSGITNILSNNGVLEPTIWTKWATTCGVLVEAIGLSVAISYRLKTIEEKLNQQLQSVLKTKVFLVQELVYRTSRPLNNISRAVDTIQQAIVALERDHPRVFPLRSGHDSKHVLLSQRFQQQLSMLRLQTEAILTGVQQTEHTIVDIHALSSSPDEESQVVALSIVWQELMHRLHDSCTSTDLARIKISPEILPEIEIENHAVILNLALEMILKLWLASFRGELQIDLAWQQHPKSQELSLRVAGTLPPIGPTLLRDLQTSINFILNPYAMSLSITASGWSIQLILHQVDDSQKNKYLA